MNNNAKYILRIILGLYLTFIGGNLIREILLEKPSDMVFKLFLGGAFVVIGVGYTIYILKTMITSYKKEAEEQKREEAAVEALHKMEQRRELAKVQTRTAPMPSKDEIEHELKEEQDEMEENELADFEEV